MRFHVVPAARDSLRLFLNSSSRILYQRFSTILFPTNGSPVLVLLDVVLNTLLVLKIEIIYKLVCLRDDLLPLASSSLVTSVDFRGLFLAPVSGGQHEQMKHSSIVAHTL